MNASARAAKAKRNSLVATRLVRVLALTLTSLTAASCASTPPPIVALTVAPQQAPATQPALKAILMSGAQPDVLAFYQAREFRPVWTDGKDHETAIADVRTALGNASQQGLRNSDYTLPRDTRPAEGTDAARYEIALRGRPSARDDVKRDLNH